MPTYIMQKTNVMVFKCISLKCIWKNKQDWIKRSVMHNAIDKGGLKVPVIPEMINTSRIMWLKNICPHTNHTPQTNMFTHYMQSIHLNPTIMLFSEFEHLNANTCTCGMKQ
jgi:hypothetical protein